MEKRRVSIAPRAPSPHLFEGQRFSVGINMGPALSVATKKTESGQSYFSWSIYAEAAPIQALPRLWFRAGLSQHVIEPLQTFQPEDFGLTEEDLTVLDENGNPKQINMHIRGRVDSPVRSRLHELGVFYRSPLSGSAWTFGLSLGYARHRVRDASMTITMFSQGGSIGLPETVLKDQTATRFYVSPEVGFEVKMNRFVKWDFLFALPLSPSGKGKIEWDEGARTDDFELPEGSFLSSGLVIDGAFRTGLSAYF